jgi:hypothetical protein
MIVALARKLLIVLWRLAATGEMPGCLLLTTGLLHSNGMTTLELQTTDRGGGNPTLDYGLRAAV